MNQAGSTVVIQLTLRSQTIAELFPVVELLIEKSGRATICFGTWISIKMKERSANKVLNVTRKKNDSTTKQDMKDCGVAGSSVVLKSEFTTHTQKKTRAWGRKLHENNHHTKREDIRYNRLCKIIIHLRHRLIKGM